MILIVSNNAGKTTIIFWCSKPNSSYCLFQPKDSCASCVPLSVSDSSVSVAIFFSVFNLTSSLITLYFSHSSKINRNSSSATLLSLKALEICEDMVSNFAEAIVLIFSCYSALDIDFFTLYLPIILRNPVKSATPSIAMTVGVAITVDSKATPSAPPPKVIAIKTVYTLSTILAALKYILLKASLVATSFSRNA